MKFLEQYIGTMPANLLPLMLLFAVPFQIAGYAGYSFARKSHIWQAHLVGILIPPLAFGLLLAILFVFWLVFDKSANDWARIFYPLIFVAALVEGLLINLLFAMIVQGVLYWKN